MILQYNEFAIGVETPPMANVTRINADPHRLIPFRGVFFDNSA
jgi:hypothetical protein